MFEEWRERSRYMRNLGENGEKCMHANFASKDATQYARKYGENEKKSWQMARLLRNVDFTR